MVSAPKPSDKADAWNASDIAFAATELGREYPSVDHDKVVAAVIAAEGEISPDVGRVRLAVRAREILRKIQHH